MKFKKNFVIDYMESRDMIYSQTIPNQSINQINKVQKYKLRVTEKESKKCVSLI